MELGHKKQVFHVDMHGFIFFIGVGVVLASYTWGRDAQRHTGMSDEILIDECVKSLAKIHSMSYDAVKRKLMDGVVKRWDLDEYALGAFTMFHPFQVLSRFRDCVHNCSNVPM